MKATEQLKAEHQAVRTAMAILEQIAFCIEEGEEFETGHLEQLLDFIRVFIDRCHHGKEEDILFPAMEAAGASAEGTSTGVLLGEHETMRGQVRKLADALNRCEQGEEAAAAEMVTEIRSYLRKLAAHIEDEDKLLFTAADRHLDALQQEKLSARFEELEERRIGPGVHDRFHQLLHDLEEIYLKEKASLG